MTLGDQHAVAQRGLDVAAVLDFAEPGGIGAEVVGLEIGLAENVPDEVDVGPLGLQKTVDHHPFLVLRPTRSPC